MVNINKQSRISKSLTALERGIKTAWPKFLTLSNTPVAVNSFLPPFLWALLIYFFSSQEVLPGFETSLSDFIFKKSAHIFVYAVLYFLTYRGLYIFFQQRNKQIPSKLWLSVLIICLLYSISDEFHQSQVSGRHATLRDVGYDMLGGSIALLKKTDYI